MGRGHQDIALLMQNKDQPLVPAFWSWSISHCCLYLTWPLPAPGGLSFGVWLLQKEEQQPEGWQDTSLFFHRHALGKCRPRGFATLPACAAGHTLPAGSCPAHLDACHAMLTHFPKYCRKSLSPP